MSQRFSFTDGAAAIGRLRGRDAAAWVFNGTASAASQHGAQIVTGAGCKPSPADGHKVEGTGAAPAAQVGIRPRGEDPGNAAAAYLRAAHEAFWNELERLCDAFLADGG